MNRACIYLLLLASVSCGKKTKESSTNASTPAPLVNALKYYNHFSFNNVYTLDLLIGGKSLETVLDTGSSNLLAIGDSTHCSNCVNEYGYSSVYTPGSGSEELSSSWSMSFAPIGEAEVQGYQDTVSFQGKSLKSYSFGLVTSEEGIPNIWGIAYQPDAQPSQAPQLPLFDSLVQTYNYENQFSLTLCALKTGSSVTLGGYDSNLTKNLSNVQWTPIVQKLWYSVPVTRIYLVGTGTSASPQWAWTPASSDTVIIDSGTNPLVIPGTQLAALVSVLKTVTTQSSIPDDFWPTSTAKGGLASISDSDIANFPVLNLDLTSFSDSSKTFTLSISPSTYFQTNDGGQRFLGLIPGSSPYILGTVFMENYVVLHNRGTLSTGADSTAKVGFYPNTGFCN